MSVNPHWEHYERNACYIEHRCNCEPYSDGMIMQPLAVASSIPYSILGIFYFVHYLQKNHRHKRLMLLGLNLIFMGFASAFIHSSFIQIAEIFDYSSIFLIMSWTLLQVSWPQMKFSKFLYVWPLLAAIPSAALMIFKGKGIIIFAIIFFPLLFKLVHYHKIHRTDPELQSLLKKMIISMSLAILFNLSDIFRILCLDSIHLHGHTLWHLFTTVAMFHLLHYFERVLSIKDKVVFTKRKFNFLRIKGKE